MRDAASGFTWRRLYLLEQFASATDGAIPDA